MRANQTPQRARFRLVLGIGATLIGCGLAAAASRPAWRAMIWPVASAPPVVTEVPVVAAVEPPAVTAVARPPVQAAVPADDGRQVAMAEPVAEPVRVEPGMASQIELPGDLPVLAAQGAWVEAEPADHYVAQDYMENLVFGLYQQFMMGDLDAGAALFDVLENPPPLLEAKIEASDLPLTGHVMLQLKPMIAWGGALEVFAIAADDHAAIIEQKVRGTVTFQLMVEGVGGEGATFEFCPEIEPILGEGVFTLTPPVPSVPAAPK